MTTITTEAALEEAARDGVKYERTAAVRITLRRNTASVTLLGASAALRGPGLFLDEKRIARWRHDLEAWFDEHGQSYDSVKIEAVS